MPHHRAPLPHCVATTAFPGHPPYLVQFRSLQPAVHLVLPPHYGQVLLGGQGRQVGVPRGGRALAALVHDSHSQRQPATQAGRRYLREKQRRQMRWQPEADPGAEAGHLLGILASAAPTPQYRRRQAIH
jgi:hypothetical protein